MSEDGAFADNDAVCLLAGRGAAHPYSGETSFIRGDSARQDRHRIFLRHRCCRVLFAGLVTAVIET